MLSEGLTDREEGIVATHFTYLSDLKEKSVVKLAGRTTNTDVSGFGVVIFEAEDEQAARRLMENDPAVAAGVMTARLFPFRIALMDVPAAGQG